jgi:hypothetical protein
MLLQALLRLLEAAVVFNIRKAQALQRAQGDLGATA